MARRPAQYDTLLRIRKTQEDLRAHALASARSEVYTAERQRAALAAERQGLLAETGQRARHGCDAAVLRAYYQYERHLARLIDGKDAELAQLRGVLERRSAELEIAMKSRRMVEKLRERGQRAFEAEVRKDEQKRLDEAATNAFAMERSAPGAAAAPNGSRGQSSL